MKSDYDRVVDRTVDGYRRFGQGIYAIWYPVVNRPTIDELDAWCEDRLGKAKRPRDFTFLHELPRTSVGKIRKFILKEDAS